VANAAGTPATLTTLEKALIVVGIAGAGAAFFYLGAKIVQQVRVNELRRLGAPHVHRIGLSGVGALVPLPSGNLALHFRGFDRGRANVLELGAPVE
jgi:hypothetical protein